MIFFTYDTEKGNWVLFIPKANRMNYTSVSKFFLKPHIVCMTFDSNRGGYVITACSSRRSDRYSTVPEQH